MHYKCLLSCCVTEFSGVQEVSVYGPTFQYKIQAKAKIASNAKGSGQFPPCNHTIQVIAGPPRRLRATLHVEEDGAVLLDGEHDEDDPLKITDINGKCFREWPTACLFARLEAQLVDEWDFALSPAAVKEFKPSNAVLKLDHSRLLEGGAKAPGEGLKEIGPRPASLRSQTWIFKQLKIRGDVESGPTTLTVALSNNEVQPAQAKITFLPMNKVIGVEIDPDPYNTVNGQTQTFVVGQSPPGFKLRLITEDRRPYSGLAQDAIKIECMDPNGDMIKNAFVVSPVKTESGEICVEPAENILKLAGRYELKVLHKEARKQLLKMLMPREEYVDLATPQHFDVVASDPFHLRIEKYRRSDKPTVNNGDEHNSRSIVHDVRLQLYDHLGNKSRNNLPHGELQVSAQLLPFQEEINSTRDLYAEFIFLFCTDSAQGEILKEARASVDSTSIKIRDLLDAWRRKRDRLEEQRALVAAADEERNKNVSIAQRVGIPQDVLNDHHRWDQHLHELRSGAGARRGLVMGHRMRDLIKDVRQRYGNRFVGTLAELLVIDDDAAAKVISWYHEADLMTLIFRYREDARDYHNMNPRARVTSLQIATKPEHTYQGRIVLHRSAQDEWKTRLAVVNLVEFANPADEYLRVEVAYSIFQKTVLVTSLDEAMNRAERGPCPTQLCRDGKRLDSRGIMGGARSVVPKDAKQFGVILGSRDNGPSQTKALEALKRADEIFRDEKQTLDLMNTRMQSEQKEHDQQMAILTEEKDQFKRNYQELKKSRNRLEQQTVPKPPEAQQSPPELEQEVSLVRALSPDGSVNFDVLRLGQNIGKSEGHYTLRFQVQRADGAPLRRKAEALPPERIGLGAGSQS